MFNEKIFDVYIAISAQEMNERDIDGFIFKYIKQEYEGFCYGNSLIKEILEIVKRSGCELSKITSDGSGRISVKFRALVKIYRIGEVLTDAQVKTTNRNLGLVHADGLHLNVRVNSRFQVKEGMFIPVRLTAVSYPQGESHVIGVAQVYVFSLNFYITQMEAETEVRGEVRGAILSLISRIEILKKQLSESPRAQFFANLFYPFKAVKKQSFKITDILTLAQEYLDNPVGVDVRKKLIRHPVLHRETSEILIAEDSELKEPPRDLFGPQYGAKYRVLPVGETLIDLLGDQEEFLSTVISASQTFADDSRFDQHASLWKKYEEVKY